MSSAKSRLAQIDKHLQDRPSSDSTASEMICTTYEHSPGHNVAKIVFFNPAKLNVASRHLLRPLIQTCEALTPGKPAAFIVGADIQELSQLSSADEARQFITHVHNACVALQNIRVPVIARVDGFALGAGLELMAACDLRLATRASKFGMPELKFAVPSLIEAALFPGLIGFGRTKRLIYLAENISADLAEQWGLIESVVENLADLDRAVDEWVSTVVSMGPEAVRNQKRLIRKWENSTLEQGIQAGIESLAEAYADGGQEVKEYMKPFLGRKR